MIKKYITLCACTLAFMTACNYEEVNTDRYGVSDEELGPLKYGARFLDMQQQVIPIGSPNLTTGPGNHLQNTDLISSGNYIGYWGSNNNWGFNNEHSWNFADNRMLYAYDNFYRKIFLQWNEIYQLVRELSSPSPSEKAMMEIVNIVRNIAWLRATDVFGPISYTTAGDGSIAPKFDSQEVVYKRMLADLDASVDILKDISFNVLADYDLIYGGDVKKWTKLANSLMLRMAVRVHFVDSDLARTYINKALDPARGGVIESVADEAKIQTSDKMPLLNSMIASVSEYNETRLGATIWAYLTGYADGRIQHYFEMGTFGPDQDRAYYPIAPANTQSKNTEISNTRSPMYAARPRVTSATPLYWFRASETYFLKAEAALFGFISESAQTLYEQGIATSFQENGVLGATAYIESTNKPSALTDYKYGVYSDDISVGNTSPKWDDLAGVLSEQDEQLQKIITQKYLALYPNAVEAWTEYRRTGFPFIMKPMDSAAPGRIGLTQNNSLRAPERFRFAPSAYTSNPNMSEIATLLGGDDMGATQLWWVRPDRPKQSN